MSIESEDVQVLVDHIETTYEEQTILNGVEALPPTTQRFDHECHEETVVATENFGTNLEKYQAENLIREIIRCEEDRFLHDLENAAGRSVAIDDDFGNALLTDALTAVDYPLKLFLPEQIEYMSVLASQYNISDYIPYNYNIPIHWFDPDIFADKGFVISRQVAVIQKRQGDHEVVNDALDVDAIDHLSGENRVIVHLRDAGSDAVEIDLRTEFTTPETIDNDSICTLNLPSPADLSSRAQK